MDNYMYHKIPYFSKYEIHKDGYVRVVKTKQEVNKSYKKAINGYLYNLLHDSGKVVTVRHYMLMLLTFNPYELDDIKGYLKLNHNKIDYLNGDVSDVRLCNLKVKDEFIYILKQNDNSIISSHKEIVDKFWDYDKNDELGLYPENYTYGMDKEVWWKCEKGHSYLKSINSQLKSLGCKVCNKYTRVSIPQQILYIIFKKNFKEVELEKQIGKYRIDLYIKDVNLAIEYDGDVFHRTQERINKDLSKEKLIKYKMMSDIIRIREEGCLPIHTCSTIYTFKNLYNNNYTELKEIAYGIILNYKDSVIKVDAIEVGKLVNSIWFNSKNSLDKTYPQLEKYFSIDNEPNFNDLSKGSHYNAKWVCPKCGFYWEQNVHSIIQLKSNNFCPNCERGYSDIEGNYFYRFMNHKLNKNVIFSHKVNIDKINKVKMKDKFCKSCNKKFKGENQYYCSKECFIKHKTEYIPSKEELVRLLEETPNFSVLSKKLNVADNTIRKWCMKYNLPHKTKDWAEIYLNNKGYTHNIYLSYLKLKKDDSKKLKYVLDNFNKTSKYKMTEVDKIIGGKMYDFIKIYYNF